VKESRCSQERITRHTTKLKNPLGYQPDPGEPSVNGTYEIAI